jgi:hypothetical protein
MRRTWIGAAAAAGLTTVAASALAFAQEKQPAQGAQPPAASQRMENGQQGQMGQAGAEPGGQSAKPAMKGEGTGNATQREQPQGAEKRANQAQSNTPNRANEKTEKGAQAQERKGQPEKGAQAQKKDAQPTERTGQAPAGGNRAGEARTGQTGETGQQSGQARAMQNRPNEARTGAGPTGGNGTQNVQATGSAHISQDRASQIAQTLTATAMPQNVNVDVSVGGLLPGDVDVRPLPPSVVELVPEFSGYDYFVAPDEIVIVQPTTRRVVEVIREGEPTQAMAPAGAGGRISLTEPQRRMLFDRVHRQHVPEANVEVELSDGATVPAEVTLEPVPQEVVTEIPMIERYRFFLANDRVVLVDPDTREVIGIVR